MQPTGPRNDVHAGVVRERTRLSKKPRFSRSVLLALIALAIAVIPPPLAVADDSAGVEYPLPTPKSHAGDIIVGADGKLWFMLGGPDAIGRISLEGVIDEFHVPTPDSLTDLSALVLAPDDAVWFLEGAASQVGRITPDGEITEFPLPTSLSGPSGITVGPDGALWFTESNTRRIGRITLDGDITEFPLPDGNSEPDRIVLGPDGALWFSSFQSDRIGRVTTDGEFTEFPTGLSLWGGIGVGPDEAVWFTARDRKLGRLTMDGELTVIQLDVPGPFLALTLGPDGALWYGAGANGSIVRIGDDGRATVHKQPSGDRRSFIVGLTTGPDGALWYTDYDAGVVGRLDPTMAVVDCQAFGADLTVPDGAHVAPSQVLDKVWRIRNCGTTAWERFSAVRTEGDLGPTEFAVPPTQPGDNTNVSVKIVAPAGAGCHSATYALRGPRGMLSDGFGVEIMVEGTLAPGAVVECPHATSP
jgi:virginiamycin B lyase